MGASPAELLDLAFQQALSHVEKSIIMEPQIAARVETICRYIGNRACVRFILACALAKAHRPDLDIRKPYTEIGTPDAFSGRTYDEAFITKFVLDHGLPCNNTTAFLTPAFRNRNTVLTPDLTMVGRPESLYKETLQLLTDVQTEKVSASDLLVEVVRCLLVFRDENRLRMESLIASLKRSEGLVSLSAEAILGLIEQHLMVNPTKAGKYDKLKG